MENGRISAMEKINDNLTSSTVELHRWINRSFSMQPDESSLIHKPIDDCLDVFGGQFSMIDIGESFIHGR